MPKSRSNVKTRYCAIRGAGKRARLVAIDWKLNPAPLCLGGNESITIAIRAGP